jgi:hypothetical protein
MLKQLGSVQLWLPGASQTRRMAASANHAAAPRTGHTVVAASAMRVGVQLETMY